MIILSRNADGFKSLEIAALSSSSLIPIRSENPSKHSNELESPPLSAALCLSLQTIEECYLPVLNGDKAVGPYLLKP